jgi:hypothetical protein
MNKMTIIQSSSTIEAQKQTENALYGISYLYNEMNGEKNLLGVTISVAEKITSGAEEGYTSVGNMTYDHGNISMSGFPLTDKTVDFINDFLNIIDEIKDAIKS